MIAATPARGAIASAKSKGIGERQHGERGLGGDAELAMTQPSALNLCAKSTFNQFLEVILAGTICDRGMRSISA
jgi:hypothetical protein